VKPSVISRVENSPCMQQWLTIYNDHHFQAGGDRCCRCAGPADMVQHCGCAIDHGCLERGSGYDLNGWEMSKCPRCGGEAPILYLICGPAYPRVMVDVENYWTMMGLWRSVAPLVANDPFLALGGEVPRCTICLETILFAGMNVDAIIIPCGHAFHIGCIAGYLVTRHRDGERFTCPNCRDPLDRVYTTSRWIRRNEWNLGAIEDTENLFNRYRRMRRHGNS